MKLLKEKLAKIALVALTLMMAVTLGAGVLAPTPVEAYSVQPQPGGADVVQVYIDGYWDAWCLYSFPQYAADAVIYVAKMRGMDIQRSKSSIVGEIRVHAAAYMAGERQHSNPMDIEMYSAPWWSYIAD